MLSTKYAWAAGAAPGNRTLILRWNGVAWKRVPSPRVAGLSGLASLAVSSSHNAWAVGCRACSQQPKTLIVHWNGKTWK